MLCGWQKWSACFDICQRRELQIGKPIWLDGRALGNDIRTGSDGGKINSTHFICHYPSKENIFGNRNSFRDYFITTREFRQSRTKGHISNFESLRNTINLTCEL